jgi:hypothetical protein
MTELRQTSLTVNMTLNDKIKLCHSRIPQTRRIVGFLDTGLIMPLPIWSPVPEPYRRTPQDSFHIIGLEAQHPRYLPEQLKRFVRFEKRGRNVILALMPGAYKRKANSASEEVLTNE